MEKLCTWAASVISTVTKAVMSEIPHEEQAAPRQEFLYTIEARTPFSVVPSASIAHCLGCLFGTVRGMDSARHGTGLPGLDITRPPWSIVGLMAPIRSKPGSISQNV